MKKKCVGKTESAAQIEVLNGLTPIIFGILVGIREDKDPRTVVKEGV